MCGGILPDMTKAPAIADAFVVVTLRRIELLIPP